MVERGTDVKILFVAMSGVRAFSDELNQAGLTLPGVVERSRVIASLPSLGLLTLAGLTPPDIEVDYREIADLRTERDLPDGYDLVAISSFSAQIYDAYDVARRYRARNTPTIMGGLHVTALPDEALQHCDCVVVGEAEPLWPQIIADLRRSELKKRYQPAPGVYFDFQHSPMPRFDLLDIDRYNRLTVQSSRGCPHQCHFCASSILLTPRYAVKPVERVIAEIRAIKRLWPQPFIEFADDNSFVHKSHYRALLKALASERVKWFTEADISLADDPEMIDLMRESGCRQVLIGLESPARGGLDGVELRRNWKLRMLDRYEAGVRAIQSRGVTVNGCFILGLDGDGPEVFESVYEFARRTNLFDVQITVLTPFPGTPLYQRLLAEGRILHPGDWRRCTLFDVNFQPSHMRPDELQRGLVALARRLYDPAFVESRRRGFFDDLQRNGIKPGPGIPGR